MRVETKRGLACTLLLLSVMGCRREQASEQPAKPVATVPAQAPAAAMQDVSEQTREYIIGISYPPVASRYPAVGAELRRYADAARADLMEAVSTRKDDDPPYELVLPFAQLHVSPTLVAVGVDGSSYTGGAHGNPLIARWLWLPREQRFVSASELVPEAQGWEAISGFVREQLHTALSQRVDADALPPQERAEVLKGAGQMIEEGTQPDPEHFSQFEPMVGAHGRLRGLRFVFPPYQVGPYSDGTQTVEVPASQLLPHVAPVFRALFEQGVEPTVEQDIGQGDSRDG